MANDERAYPPTTIRRLVEAVLARESHEREAFLRHVCAGDDGLRRHVATLLAEAGHLGSFSDGRVPDESDRSPELVGRRIGPFRVLALVGAGAMGEVYRARDLHLGRDVAIKILAPTFTADARRLARLKREARILGSLNHPNVCAIHGYEIGQTSPPMPDGSNVHGIVLELVEGETLAERIGSAGALAPSEAVALADQIAGAFEVVHKKGVIHRDLKPANVKVTPDGTVKVLDFGLAKVTAIEGRATGFTATAEGAVCGTPAYMSPEQALGHRVDGRTDIWAFGCVLFEMLAGRRPFGGDTLAGVIAEILEAEPDWSALADTPAGLRALLGRCLSKTPAERPVDFTEIRRAMSVAVEALSGGSEPLVNDVAVAPRRRPGQAFRWPGFATGMIAAAVVGSITAAGAYARWGTSMAGGSRVLTDRDTIIVADFTNRTGDPVFDGTLKLALTVALEQSPFIRVFPETRVRDALPLMGRSADERVTPVVAREIARREDLKALVAGSIASLGRNYVLTLEATNALTGDVMTREQSEVASKEQVLAGLESAARGLRGKLGESLPSIQRFDVPLPRATTSSIDALYAYGLALEGGQQIPRREAIPHLERAIELDSEFALAYAFLSSVYANTGQPELAPQFSRRAFELRDRVSDRERFFIAWRYYVDAEQAWDKALDLAQAWTTSFPREPAAFNSLGLASARLGQDERALEAFRTTIQLDERMGLAYSNAAASLLALNRPDDALELLRQAEDRRLEFPAMNRIRFMVALIRNDSATMARLVETSTGVSSTSAVFGLQAHASAFAGQVTAAHEQFHRGIRESSVGRLWGGRGRPHDRRCRSPRADWPVCPGETRGSISVGARRR